MSYNPYIRHVTTVAPEQRPRPSAGAPHLGDARRSPDLAGVRNLRPERNLGTSAREHRLLAEPEDELVGTAAREPFAPGETAPLAVRQVDADTPRRFEARRHEEVVAAEELVIEAPRFRLARAGERH